MAVPRAPGPSDRLTYWPSPKWLRAHLGGVVVLDTRRAVLVWEPGRHIPAYAVPREDMADGVLRRSDAPPGERHGAAVLWHLEAGGRRSENGAWSYEDAELADFVAVDARAADAWLEEDEEVISHPRDPFHRIDVRSSSRHVRVVLDDVVLADSPRPLALFETGLPPRWYLEPDDVRMDRLAPSATRTRCPYKGEASHFSAELGGERRDDVAWMYADPLADAGRLRGLVAFYPSRVALELDGERQPR